MNEVIQAGCVLCGNADNAVMLQGAAYCAAASGCEDARLARAEDALYPACALCGNTHRRKQNYRYGNPSCVNTEACKAERRRKAIAAMPRRNVDALRQVAQVEPIIWCVACGAKGFTPQDLAADPACSAREECARGGF